MGTMQLRLAIAGEKVVIAGLALQVATFVVFLAACIDFHMRMAAKFDRFSPAPHDPSTWRRMMWTLYALSVLILFRCVFRLVEYAMGNAAYLIAHEWTLYVFDAVPMFLVLVLFVTVRVGGPEARGLGESEKMEESSSSSDGELGGVRA